MKINELKWQSDGWTLVVSHARGVDVFETPMGFELTGLCCRVSEDFTGLDCFTCGQGSYKLRPKGGVGCAALLGKSPIMAFAGSGGDFSACSPCHVVLWHIAKRQPLSVLEQSSPVRNLGLTEHRLIVQREDGLSIYAFDLRTRTPPVKVQEIETDKPRFGAGVQVAAGPEIFCCPGSNSASLTSGAPCKSLTSKMRIRSSLLGQFSEANPTGASCISSDGALVVVAMNSGRAAHMYRTDDLEFKLKTFSRTNEYMPNEAEIYSLTLSMDSTLLAMVSDTGTIHVFRTGRSTSDPIFESRDSVSETVSFSDTSIELVREEVPLDVVMEGSPLSSSVGSTWKVRAPELGRCVLSLQQPESGPPTLNIAYYNGEIHSYTLHMDGSYQCRGKKALEKANWQLKTKSPPKAQKNPQKGPGRAGESRGATKVAPEPRTTQH